MARKTKPGITYFSHDVDMLQDKKIKLLKAKHGLVGYAVYLRLLEELYRENGYYLRVDNDFNILFSDDNNLDYNVYILILNDCILHKLFDEKLYKKYQILTSIRIQDNYFSATERRKEVEFVREYLLTDPKEFYNVEKVNVYIEALNVDIETLNADIGTQSKVKKSKVKKSKNIYNMLEAYTDNENVYEELVEFVKMREAKKKPPTERAMQLIFKKLDQLTDTQKIEVLAKSTVNNWTDVYIDKVKQNSSEIKIAKGWNE